MIARSTTRLTEEGVKVCGSLPTAGPEFKTFMEHREARVVSAHGVIGMWSLIGSTATTIFA